MKQNKQKTQKIKDKEITKPELIIWKDSFKSW